MSGRQTTSKRVKYEMPGDWTDIPAPMTLEDMKRPIPPPAQQSISPVVPDNGVLLLLNEAISMCRREGVAGQHLGAMCDARDEIERLRAALAELERNSLSGNIAETIAREAPPHTLQNATTWRPPSESAGGQCIAVDQDGDECCAFHDHRNGLWHRCTNLVGADTNFQPRAWTPLPRMEPVR
jgi:hypothetical protein